MRIFIKYWQSPKTFSTLYQSRFNGMQSTHNQCNRIFAKSLPITYTSQLQSISQIDTKKFILLCKYKEKHQLHRNSTLKNKKEGAAIHPDAPSFPPP